jgi:hypothetical protein
MAGTETVASDELWKAERWPGVGWFVTAPNPDGSGRRITIAEFREVVYGPLYTHLCERNAKLLAQAGNSQPES